MVNCCQPPNYINHFPIASDMKEAGWQMHIQAAVENMTHDCLYNFFLETLGTSTFMKKNIKTSCFSSKLEVQPWETVDLYSSSETKY